MFRGRSVGRRLPGVAFRQQGFQFRVSGAMSRPPAKGLRMPIITIRQPFVSFREPILVFRHLRKTILNSRKTILSCRKPILSSRKSILSSRRPILSSRRPIINSRKDTLDSRKTTLHVRRAIPGIWEAGSRARRIQIGSIYAPYPVILAVPGGGISYLSIGFGLVVRGIEAPAEGGLRRGYLGVTLVLSGLLLVSGPKEGATHFPCNTLVRVLQAFLYAAGGRPGGGKGHGVLGKIITAWPC